MKWNRKFGGNKDVALTVPFVFLMGTSLAFGERLTINKCCPKGEEFNSTLMCVITTGDLSDNKINNTMDAGGKTSLRPAENSSKIYFPDSVTDETYSWFPFDSVMSSSNLGPMPDREAIKKIIDKADLKFGVRPSCRAEDRVSACFGRDSWGRFRLILFSDGDVKLYVPEKSSYSEEHFRVERRDCGSSGGNNSDEKGVGDLPPPSLFKSEELTTFPLGDVCMDKGPGKTFFVMFCPCNTVRCVRKCCQHSEVFDRAKGKCVPFLRALENSSLTTDYYLLSGRRPWTCEKYHLLKLPRAPHLGSTQACGDPGYLDDGNEFHFLSDGSLKVKKYKSKIPPRSYCGDRVMFNSTVFLENNLLVCLEDESPFSKLYIYGVLFVIGGVLLLLTVFVSLYLPELRSSVYSKVIICHNVTLMLAYFMWGPTYLFQFVTHDLCALFSLAIQYTFLGSLFWMSVMCLDIFLGIRCLRFPGQTINDNQKFFSYVIYACGAPVIITSFTSAMEFSPSVPPHYIRPGFRCHDCGFDPDSPAVLVYFYGPATAIIFLNVGFYISTIVQLLKIQKEISVLNVESSYVECVNRCKKKLITFGKFFLLLGLTWVAEINGWAFGGEDSYWFISVMANVLRAVFVFVAFVGKGKILRGFVEKLRKAETLTQVEKTDSDTVSDKELMEIKRRERILMKQITQTFRKSDEFPA